MSIDPRVASGLRNIRRGDDPARAMLRCFRETFPGSASCRSRPHIERISLDRQGGRLGRGLRQIFEVTNKGGTPASSPCGST